MRTGGALSDYSWGCVPQGQASADAGILTTEVISGGYVTASGTMGNIRNLCLHLVGNLLLKLASFLVVGDFQAGVGSMWYTPELAERDLFLPQIVSPVGKYQFPNCEVIVGVKGKSLVKIILPPNCPSNSWSTQSEIFIPFYFFHTFQRVNNNSLAKIYFVKIFNYLKAFPL